MKISDETQGEASLARDAEPDAVSNYFRPEIVNDDPRLIVRLKVNLSRETVADLSQRAREDGLSVAGMARMLIKRGLGSAQEAA